MRRLTVPEIMGLGHVHRWHTRLTLQPQTLADHSAKVALLALRIAGDDLPVEELLLVVVLGLGHDAHEQQGGDTPYPARMALLALGIDIDAVCSDRFWGEDGPGTVPGLIHDIVAVADKAEAALWAKHHAPDLARKIAREAQQTAMARLSDERRWSMRTRALEMLKEVL